MRRARWKRKNARDELPGKAVNSPKTGAGRHELPTELETPLPAALYLNLKSVRSRICGHGAQRGANRTSPAPLSAAAPPVQIQEGFPKGRGLVLVLRPSFPWEGFPKGRDRSPAPLCHEGAWGTVASPMFLVRV